MQNRNNQTASPSAEDLVSISAKRAAAEAVQFHNAELRRTESKFGAFAIYAWAFFAFAASGIGGSTIYLNNTEQNKAPVIVAKGAQPEQPQNADPIVTASTTPVQPVSELSNQLSSLGVNVGGFTDISVIMDIYRLVQDNRDLDLAEKEPLVQFKVENETYKAALIVGPFQDLQTIMNFCDRSQLPCEATSYSGEQLFGN